VKPHARRTSSPIAKFTPQGIETIAAARQHCSYRHAGRQRCTTLSLVVRQRQTPACRKPRGSLKQKPAALPRQFSYSFCLCRVVVASDQWVDSTSNSSSSGTILLPFDRKKGNEPGSSLRALRKSPEGPLSADGATPSVGDVGSTRSGSSGGPTLSCPPGLFFLHGWLAS